MENNVVIKKEYSNNKHMAIVEPCAALGHFFIFFLTHNNITYLIRYCFSISLKFEDIFKCTVKSYPLSPTLSILCVLDFVFPRFQENLTSRLKEYINI